MEDECWLAGNWIKFGFLQLPFCGVMLMLILYKGTRAGAYTLLSQQRGLSAQEVGQG